MGKRFNKEEFQNRINSKHGDGEYFVVGEYINSYTKILVRHNKCGAEWHVSPKNIMNGSRCFKCYGKHKKDTNIFKKEVHKLVGDEYSVVGEYTNADTKIRLIHNKCSHEFDVIPYNFLKRKGSRCPMCFGKIKKTTEQFIKEVFHIYGDEYKILGEYINKNTNILAKHNECGHCWHVNPNNLIRGHGCPECARAKLIGETNPNWSSFKTDEERVNQRSYPEYKEWLLDVYERDNYTCQICGDYTGGNLNAHHKDGYNWCIDRRNDLSNGVTLCDGCHKDFHYIYGKGMNTEEQWLEFYEEYKIEYEGCEC